MFLCIICCLQLYFMHLSHVLLHQWPIMFIKYVLLCWEVLVVGRIGAFNDQSVFCCCVSICIWLGLWWVCLQWMSELRQVIKAVVCSRPVNAFVYIVYILSSDTMSRELRQIINVVGRFRTSRCFCIHSLHTFLWHSLSLRTQCQTLE
jgi:hypothetical protein